MVKTRYFSPSAWLYCALLLPHNLAWLEKINEEKTESFQILQTCKLLAKHFQNLQILQWNYGEYGMLLAQKAIADVLIDNYLRTFETIHRILHIPSFMRDYELLWSETEVTPVKFIIQVQLCLALGSLVYDDDFTLRPQALHWTREAGAWLESAAKRRLMFSTIQTMCLYQLAREGLQGTYGDRIWIVSGSLVRAAMSIGLHRDPTKLPPTSATHAEMRRRLWTTVVELALSSCLDPGAAPLISLDDFDCKLPSNLDDAQLNLDSNHSPKPRDKDQYTDSSLQIALGRTIGTRIAMARFCTKLNPDGYDKTLGLNNDYNTACRALSESLQSLKPAPSEFQRQYCELVMSQYSFALHVQYMMICSRNPSYLLSRKVCVDTALNLARSSLPLASGHDQVLATMQAMTMNQSPQGSEFVRLCICGSGPYRSALFQALMIIASELITMIEERKGSLHWPTGLLGGDMRAHELLSLLRVGAEWTRLRMRVGQEINKDHLFVTLAISNIEALMKEEAVMEAMDVSGKIACLEVEQILKELLSAYNDEQIPEVRFSSEEDDLLGFDEMWLIQNGDFDTNLVDL
ncbi:hypothetical protein PFICI_09971 [Pestalotiopsis fici W106-1]|uniref:Xylanolytic transcriptional activator regulatory domain-containing protein n=1 Tax=Pestalotiopsis fici (strain W106-1 / CGMCC3.15140) TaxID=1229662 RepID=W3WVR7_PESFW|nr:uncharacterized protein PFICI_09971 [Pestalotiopsis fici W106-1]ETS77909.1 hypothetical protein PFICI_09971 [Pestalotiopsis fici W106-1]